MICDIGPRAASRAAGGRAGSTAVGTGPVHAVLRCMSLLTVSKAAFGCLTRAWTHQTAEGGGQQPGRPRPNITLRCQHEPNMAASITCAASKSHLHITGTRANAESRQKCRPCSITWPRVLLAAQAALLVSWRAGREHRRWFWAKACSPARPFAAGGGKGRLRMPHSGVDPPDRRRWAAVGTSSQPQRRRIRRRP